MEVWNDLLFRFDFVIWRPRKSTLHLLLTYLFLLIQKSSFNLYFAREYLLLLYSLVSTEVRYSNYFNKFFICHKMQVLSTRNKNPKIKNGFEYGGTLHRLQKQRLITIL